MKTEEIKELEDKKKEIRIWLNENTEIEGSYHINNDLTINIYGDICITNKNIFNFPYKFNIVNGFFNCGGCKKLKSLYNSPNVIRDYFNFSYTNIDSYEDGSKEIDGGLWCVGTKLKSIKPWLVKIKMCFNTEIKDNKYPDGITYEYYIKEPI